jgi:DNA polymerase IV
MEPDMDHPVIFLVDIDAFFAQVEQILRPELLGRPVIVGGLATDRSVVASASYEARARGVKTAMPIAQARRICPEAEFLRGDFHAYSRFSDAMMEICRRYTPLVQPMSLDEAYLDVTACRRLFEMQGIIGPRAALRCEGAPLAASEHVNGCHGCAVCSRACNSGGTVAEQRNRGTRNLNLDSPQGGICGGPDDADPDWPLEVAEHLRRTIRRELAMHVTVGAGTSRMVAKIACDYAKPRGVAWIRPGCEARFLAPLPIKALPGVGPRTAERLARYNLRRVGDVTRIPPAMLAEHFGPAGEVLAARARGIDPTDVSAEAGDPKSISRETTFESNLIDRAAMKAMIYYLLERACRRLRENRLLARTVTVKIRYADFMTEGRARSLPTLSDHDDDFWPVASELFDKLYTRRVGVRLVGVALSHFAPSGRQLDLFAEDAYGRRAQYYRSVDHIRERFGFSALATGRAIELLETHERDEHGFRLRTACLSQ